MRHYFIKILRNGDRVMSFTPEQIIVRRANGEVDIFRLFMDEAGVPRIDQDNIMTITYGDGTIEVAMVTGAGPLGGDWVLMRVAGDPAGKTLMSLRLVNSPKPSSDNSRP